MKKKNKIKVEYLSDKPQHVGEVARWIFDEFIHNIKPGVTYEMVVKRYSERKKHELPITIIATLDDECIGTASLVNNDLKSRDYTPWLASLYVKKEYRNIGIGKVLIKGITAIAQNLDYHCLYLRTEHASEYYKKLGWTYIENLVDEFGQNTSVFMNKIDKIMDNYNE